MSQRKSLSRAPRADEPRAANAWSALDRAASIEFPSGRPHAAEIWLYSDRMSYAAGDEAIFFVHTTAHTYSIAIHRDGASPQEVLTRSGLQGVAQETREAAFRTGARWKESFRFTIPREWPGGVYVVTVVTDDDTLAQVEAEHFFVLRDNEPGSRSKIALMLCTSTYVAYNDWGGANHYRSIRDGRATDVPEPVLSTQRPWARGFARLPISAPRHGKEARLKPFEEPRYPFIEWALTHGYSRHYIDAGWANYERHFAVWAEPRGFELEYLTQHDLHDRPELLDAYRVLVIVGHDEYWSWEMRDAVDRFVERGGNVARFAGNFIWQVRLESSGTVQVCYKAPTLDPCHDGDRRHLTTTTWDHPIVNRPSAQTMGLTGAAGVYHRVGGACPRGSGGFTVYRPDHWVFEGTDLYYGDVFGAAPTSIVSFEVDGLDYTFRDGLPYPTFKDGAPPSTEILAMAPAIKGEEDRSRGQRPLLASMTEFEYLSATLPGEPGRGLRATYGSAMIAVHTRGKGMVLNAGTASWVNGLIDHDFFTEQITRNVLNRVSHT
ncbi:MAG: N,N-dimethylformamidase beta subunit family domain-containing protein [Candidatus Rokuibacteriota bacterium]